MITGSTGLDDYEWGVTLFGVHPDDLKEVVYTMRFDRASAIYAEFGPLLRRHGDARSTSCSAAPGASRFGRVRSRDTLDAENAGEPVRTSRSSTPSVWSLPSGPNPNRS